MSPAPLMFVGLACGAFATWLCLTRGGEPWRSRVFYGLCLLGGMAWDVMSK